MERNRLTRLVVVDREGRLQGVTEPFPVAMPWWQEVGPITDLVPGAVVLRLLEATADPDQPMGGSVTYLVEMNDRDLAASGLTLELWPGPLDEQPLRHPWARPGGPAADLEWVASVVTVDGPPRQHRTWNLSAVWSIPTTDGTVWLKCLPPFFGHEIPVLQQLQAASVPRVIAADGHRCLLAEMPGRDGHDADDAQQQAMVTALVEIQLESVGRVDQLLAAGVPDLRQPQLTVQLERLVARLAPGSQPLRRLVATMAERLEAAAATGIPDTLVHGDPHSGNCRLDTDPPIWFDWGDSFIGNPLLDLAALHRMRPAAVQRWLELWSAAAPGADIAGAWKLLQPVAALRMAWVYQRFLDNIEPDEWIYHADDVTEALRDVESMLEG